MNRDQEDEILGLITGACVMAWALFLVLLTAAVGRSCGVW